jgi:hypothetical protein
MTRDERKKAGLLLKIENFISDKRKSLGDYAEVKPEDLGELYDIFDNLIRLKYQEDPDGDIPAGNFNCYRPNKV